ncbi:TPA: hypothetical protein ACG0AR_002892 [Elizabethkingia anophelis]|uniref:hypothetical protein n=1 Tax=Elizabethkingia anophelis TaxID=1117645 RepID=UPI0020B6D6A8|nr:hypothetical protein [Elizabethkingia anophelis]UTG59844.1 hypothetical protein J2O09_10420 [Elizabethkingia anophelis]UXM66031.1 hypothetical protein N7E57_10440 [Elizabethkingia anophelis]
MEKSEPYWRYQVINHGTKSEPSLAIHEMYFNIKNEGDFMWTQNPITLNNYNGLEELITSLEIILKDIKNHHILTEYEMEKKLK